MSTILSKIITFTGKLLEAGVILWAETAGTHSQCQDQIATVELLKSPTFFHQNY